MILVPKTAHGAARLATEEEIQKEDSKYYLAADYGPILTTDSGIPIVPNVGDFGYTHPDLHRRIETDPEIPEGSDYPFVKYDPDGKPYKQTVKLGVWDGMHSYRTTETITHDEESTTCEIP